jgi:di/tricarboxylate transporter
VGRKPQHVILANMLVATFASMWISNVAAPVLCFSLVQPILRTLPTSHPFCKSLVMGIALASNLGGMTSPISSPQNIFAIERMSMGGAPPSWLQWFAIALPVAVLGNLACWAIIIMAYRPGDTIKEVRGLWVLCAEFHMFYRSYMFFRSLCLMCRAVACCGLCILSQSPLQLVASATPTLPVLHVPSGSGLLAVHFAHTSSLDSSSTCCAMLCWCRWFNFCTSPNRWDAD